MGQSYRVWHRESRATRTVVIIGLANAVILGLVDAVILGLVPRICRGVRFSPQNQPVASLEQSQLHHTRQILGTSPRMTAVRVARLSELLEHFRFSSNHGSALSLCYYAIPDAKPLYAFAGIALKP
jgi:hypothetical protein